MGVFWEKKSKSPLVAGTFFETTSEAKCPDKARRGEIEKKKIKKKERKRKKTEEEIKEKGRWRETVRKPS